MGNRILLTCVAIILSLSVQSQSKWTVKECVEYGLKNNLSIQNERLNLMNSEVNLDNAKLQRLPNFNIGGGSNARWGRSIDQSTNNFVTQRIINGNAFGSTNLTVYNGNLINNSIKQSETDLLSSEYSVQDRENLVGLNILTNYLNVIFNKELLENARFQLETTAKQVDRTQKLVDAGSVPLSNLLDLRSQQASNDVDIVNRENAVNFSLLQLKQSMQLPANEPFDIIVPELNAEDYSLSGSDLREIYMYAEKSQPNVLAAELSVESAEYGEQIAKAQGMPTVSLQGSVSTNYSDAFQVFLPDGSFSDRQTVVGFLNNNQSQPVINTQSLANGIVDDKAFGDQFSDNMGQALGVSINIPIFNRGNAKASNQRASIAKERARVNAEQVKNNLRQTIETAYNDASAAAKSYEASLSQVSALTESFRMTEQRYALGAINFVDYQIINNNLFAAQSALLRSKYDYIFKIKVLEFYQGKPISF